MSKWKTSKESVISQVLTTNMPLLICANDNYILIDTGRTSARNGIIKKLHKVLGENDLSLIILTHTHHDHIENLTQILEEYPAEVLVHKSERHSLDMIKDQNFILTFEEKFNLNNFGINGFVVHTPGHSEGSSSIVVDDEIVIIGDTLGDFSTKPFAKKRKIVSDELLRSVEKLITLDCKIYIPTYKKRVYEHDELKNLYKKYLNGEIIRE